MRLGPVKGRTVREERAAVVEALAHAARKVLVAQCVTIRWEDDRKNKAGWPTLAIRCGVFDVCYRPFPHATNELPPQWWADVSHVDEDRLETIAADAVVLRKLITTLRAAWNAPLVQGCVLRCVGR